MRNLFLALAMVTVFAVAAAASGSSDTSNAECPTSQSCCGGCDTACE